MRGFISLVKDNQEGNNQKEFLVYVYFGSVANNRSKKQNGELFQHIKIGTTLQNAAKNTNLNQVIG